MSNLPNTHQNNMFQPGRANWPSYLFIDKPCRNCNGSGFLIFQGDQDYECEACKGSGEAA